MADEAYTSRIPSELRPGDRIVIPVPTVVTVVAVEQSRTPLCRIAWTHPASLTTGGHEYVGNRVKIPTQAGEWVETIEELLALDELEVPPPPVIAAARAAFEEHEDLLDRDADEQHWIDAPYADVQNADADADGGDR